MAAPRVTDCEVTSIIETNLDDVRPFIMAADAMVTQHLSNKSLSDSLLKEITRWLSAHFVACNDRRLKSEKLGDAQDNYDGATGMGLDFTQYGQQAKLLDPTGTLATLGQRSAFFEVL